MVLLLNFLVQINGLILFSILDFGFSPKLSFSNCWKRFSILFSSNLLGFLTNCSKIWSDFLLK